MPLPAFLAAKRRRASALQGAQVGIAIAGQQAHVAVLNATADGARLDALSTIELSQLSDLQSALTALVQAQGLYRVPAVISLSADYYRLQLTDAPKVPIEERNAALAFALRDLIDFPVQEAVVESFNLPNSVQRGSDRVYAVVAQAPRLQALALAVSAAGLSLAAIEIPELSVVSLLQRQGKTANATALLLQTTRGAALFLYVGDDLVLARQLAGIADLRLFAEALESGGPPDQLLIEVQRTLDYFESQLARRPIARFYIQPMPASLPAIVEALRSNLNVPVQMLSCAKDEAEASVAGNDTTEKASAAPAAGAEAKSPLPLATKLDDDALMRGFVAIGAALREVDHAAH